MVRVAVFETEFKVPVIVEEVDFDTAFVVIVVVAAEEPAAIETDDATVALDNEDASVTLMAPVALLGTAFSVTVAADVLPPTTEVGERVIEEMAKGDTVRTTVFETPPEKAVMVVVVDPVTTLCETAKLAEVAPAGTVTDAGTEPALGEELTRVTTVPPVPAAAVRVTVPVMDAVLPPTTEDEFKVTELSLAAAAGLTVSTADLGMPL